MRAAAAAIMLISLRARRRRITQRLPQFQSAAMPDVDEGMSMIGTVVGDLPQAVHPI